MLRCAGNMATRQPVPRGCTRTALLLAAAVLLLLGVGHSPAVAHKRMAPLKCQASPGMPACGEVTFKNFATHVPLTKIHRAGGLGNSGQYFEVVPLKPYDSPVAGKNNFVPQISLCRGPASLGPRNEHIWGIDVNGNLVYARPGSMLQYSHDGTMGPGTKECRYPTYPGPILATAQGVGKAAFNFRNSAGSFHPMNFAVDPRLYSAPNVTRDKITYNPATPYNPTNRVPAVVHVHGAVMPSEYDGVPYYTLVDRNAQLLHKLVNISNPPCLALYHDHAWGFTRLTVYAGAVSGFLVKENTALKDGQPKPTKKCVGTSTACTGTCATCGIPEISAVMRPSYADLQDIPLIIADKALVAPAPRAGANGGIEAELGYPVGQPNGCNSCTPPGSTTLDPSSTFCTSLTNAFMYVCPATSNSATNYCGRWSPEFFGPVNVVNGQVTPVLKLYPAVYRFRLVNGANTRTYSLTFKADNPAASSLLDMCYKIATEAGYVRLPKRVGQTLEMLPAERVELLCDLSSFTGAAVNYTVENDNPTPVGNPGQREVMKITIDPGRTLQYKVAARVANRKSEPYITRLNPNQPLAIIPNLTALYEAQTTQVEKHVMLMERFAGGCSQGLAVSECKDVDGAPAPPNGTAKPNEVWGRIPPNCLTDDGIPRNMFSDGAPLTCKEGLIEKWVWYNPTADAHPWHWHLNHVQCDYTDGTNELKETVAIPIGATATTPARTCYVACADVQYILDSGLVYQATGDAQQALDAGIAKGYNPQTGPGASGTVGTCNVTNPNYNNWDYVTHCHILEHEEYDMMAKYRIIPKAPTCTN